MSKYGHWTQQERDEHFLDLCAGFKDGLVDESIFRIELGQLGYNATDIEDIVKQNAPTAPENEDGDYG